MSITSVFECRVPQIGDTVYAVSVDGDRLVPIGTICDTLHLTDVDENLWQVWLSSDKENFEFLCGSNWYVTLSAWILDLDHVVAYNLI